MSSVINLWGRMDIPYRGYRMTKGEDGRIEIYEDSGDGGLVCISPDVGSAQRWINQQTGGDAA